MRLLDYRWCSLPLLFFGAASIAVADDFPSANEFRVTPGQRNTSRSYFDDRQPVRTASGVSGELSYPVGQASAVYPSHEAAGARQRSATPNSVATTRSPAPDAGEGLQLAPPKERRSDGERRTTKKTPAGAVSSVLGSLSVVLGVFFLLVWFLRRTQPRANANLPKEVVEILGRTPLSGRQNMHLVRVGNKLLLLSVTPTGAETLTEIVDGDEIDRISGLCQKNQPGSITQTFRQVLSHFEKEPAPSGFLGDASDDRQFEHAAADRPLRGVMDEEA